MGGLPYDRSAGDISYSTSPRLDRNDPLYDEELTAALFSPDGSTILLSNGNTYSGDLSLNQKVVDPFENGIWMPNGEIVILRSNILHTYNTSGEEISPQLRLQGDVVGILNYNDDLIIVSKTDQGISFLKNPVFK